jgi:hypothetical protein
MNAMAIDAHGHLAVTSGEEFAVHAGLVLRQLVGAQGRVVLPHESRIGVTTTAKLWDIFAFDLPAKSYGFAHGLHVRFAGIAAVTTRAG